MPTTRLRRPSALRSFCALLIATSLALVGGRTSSSAAESATPAAWTNDLAPITPADWNPQRAAHLLERAGFGGTPEEIQRLAAMSPRQAIDSLIDFESLKGDQ